MRSKTFGDAYNTAQLSPRIIWPHVRIQKEACANDRPEIQPPSGARTRARPQLELCVSPNVENMRQNVPSCHDRSDQHPSPWLELLK